MTKQSSFKERIRARMAKTGESYTTARRRLLEKAAAKSPEPAPSGISGARPSDEQVKSKTGRAWEDWFKLLDRWGGTERKHGDIAKFLVEEHDVPGWWAQSITVSYERERGMRAPGQRADGYFSVSASKTVNVPVAVLYQAFTDDALRAGWLGEHELEMRTTRENKSMTARWGDGSTRLTASFEPKGEKKSVVALAHERVPDAAAAGELKIFWRARLDELKTFLEI